MFFMFLNNPSVKALPVISAQRFHLFFTIFTISSRIAVLWCAFYYFHSDIVTVGAFGVLNAFINIILIVMVLFKCMKYDKLEKDVL